MTDASQLDYGQPPVSRCWFRYPTRTASQFADVIISLINRPSLSGVVFVDANENGLFDANESGIGGVRMELLDAAGCTLQQRQIPTALLL